MSATPEREEEAKAWIQEVLKIKINGSLIDALKDGVILCKLANAVREGTCKKFKESKIAFVCRQNIEIYLIGCEQLGLKSTDRFESRDLYDGQRPKAVIDNIFALSASSRNIPSFKGPYIGVKFSEKNERNFSQEILAKSISAVPLWSKGDKEQKNEEFDAYGIIKGKKMDKHTGAQSKWESGSLANDTSSKHDSYGVIKVKGTDKHTGAQSKWETGSLANDTSSKHDSYGVIKVKGVDKHTGAQSKWETGALPVNTSTEHDSYGIIKVKGMDKHTGVQNKMELGSIPTDVSSKQDSYGIIKQ